MSGDNITGRTYLESGKPVVVLRRWSSERATLWAGIPLVWLRRDGKPPRSGPRNVLIDREDGSRVVRSFRGLRRWQAEAHTPLIGVRCSSCDGSRFWSRDRRGWCCMSCHPPPATTDTLHAANTSVPRAHSETQ